MIYEDKDGVPYLVQKFRFRYNGTIVITMFNDEIKYIDSIIVHGLNLISMNDTEIYMAQHNVITKFLTR